MVSFVTAKPKSTDNSLYLDRKSPLCCFSRCLVTPRRAGDIWDSKRCPLRGDSRVCVVSHRQNNGLAGPENFQLIFICNENLDSHLFPGTGIEKSAEFIKVSLLVPLENGRHPRSCINLDRHPLVAVTLTKLYLVGLHDRNPSLRC